MIAIIAILASLLLPALSTARQKAKRIQCVSNLKQWALGQIMCAGDNSEMLARDGMGGLSQTYPGNPEPSGTPDDPYAWFNAVPPNLSDKMCFSNFYHTTASMPQDKFPFPGRPKGSGIWLCPSATMTDDEAASLYYKGEFGFFSYADNFDLRSGVYPSMPRLTTFPNPVRTVLMFDTAFNPSSEVVNGSPAANSQNPANRYRTVGMRHDKGAVFTFIDGHVMLYKINAVTNTVLWGRTGSGEPQNPNIIWNWHER